MFSVKGKEYRVVRIREDEPFKVNDIVVAIESGTEVPYCVPKDIYEEEKKFYNYDEDVLWALIIGENIMEV